MSELTARAERLTYMQRRLLDVKDAKLSRCWYCGEWRYDRQDCSACTAPHDRGGFIDEAGVA